MNRLIKIIFILTIISGVSFKYFEISKIFFFRILSFVGILLFYFFLIIYFFNRANKSKKRFYVFDLMSFYLIIIFIVLIFSLGKNEINLITLFFHPYSFPSFFIAIIALLVNKQSLNFLSSLSRVVSYLIPFVTVMDLLLFDNPVFIISCYSFLLFDFLTTSNSKRKFFIILLLIGTIFLFQKYDYRSGILIIVMFLLGLVSSYIFRFFHSKFFKTLFLLIALVLVYFVSFHFTQFFELLIESFNLNIVSTTDTRSFLFLELFADFKNSDFLLGRGYLGTYYSPYFQEWRGEGGDHFQRFSVEVGFLQLILKGGITLLVATSFVFLRNIYLGFVNYKSNTFIFFTALWLLIEFIMFSIENFPSFSVHFFFIWILVGILVNSKQNKSQNKLPIYL